MTTNATDDSTARADAPFSPVTRRRALVTLGTLGTTFAALTPGTAAAASRFHLAVTSSGGTTLWQAAVSPGANFRQVRNSDGARDTIGNTYHETGEVLTSVTAYTRNGTDTFAFDGDARDLRYLVVSYSTGGEPTITLDGRRIGPFGSWETASPKGIGPGPF